MKRLSTAAVILFTTLLFSCGGNPDAIGREYESESELNAAQAEIGFVRLGTFGNHWPADIVEVKTNMNSISFTAQNGTPHTYPGYDGYELKYIRLKNAAGKENVMVYRSEDKKEL